MEIATAILIICLSFTIACGGIAILKITMEN